MSASPDLHRWRAFALLAVAYFMTVVDLTIVNTALPTIGRDLDAPTALTGGFQHALWALAAIALLALPAIFALVRRNELSDAARKTTIREPEPALATAE